MRRRFFAREFFGIDDFKTEKDTRVIGTSSNRSTLSGLLGSIKVIFRSWGAPILEHCRSHSFCHESQIIQNSTTLVPAIKGELEKALPPVSTRWYSKEIHKAVLCKRDFIPRSFFHLLFRLPSEYVYFLCLAPRVFVAIVKRVESSSSAIRSENHHPWRWFGNTGKE